MQISRRRRGRRLLIMYFNPFCNQGGILGEINVVTRREGKEMEDIRKKDYTTGHTPSQSPHIT
jgi:hypothetical protein